MSNVTTDFIAATKKIHADVRQILTTLRLIQNHIKVIHDHTDSATHQSITTEEHPSGVAPHSAKKDGGSYEAKQYALDEKRFGLEEKAFKIGKRSLVVLALYTLLTGYQSYQSKRSADAAQDTLKETVTQFRIINRAFVVPIIELERSLPGDSPILAHVDVKNVGKTPARNVNAAYIMEQVPKNAKAVFSYENNPVRKNAFTGLLFPDESFGKIGVGLYPDDKATIQPEDRFSLVSGETYLILFMRITYTDSFGIDHWTQSCAWHAYKAIEGAYPASNCALYNETDKNE